MRRVPILAVVGLLSIGMLAVCSEATLNISATPGGSVMMPGMGSFTYEYCTEVELRAEADWHYRFVRWTGDTATIEDPGAATTTIAIRDHHVIKAVFERTRHELAVSSTEGGRATVPGEGTHVYDYCSEIRLQAEAEDGYRFVQWTGDVDTIGDPKAANTTIAILGDFAITAEFERKMCNLSVSSTANGRVVVPGESVFSYGFGTEVELRAEADPDYRFVRWAGDIGAIEDPWAASSSIVMRGDYEIKAVFESMKLTLDVRSTKGGRVVVPGEGLFSYDYCSEVELWAEADRGHHFVQWTGDTAAIRDLRAARTAIDSMLDDYQITALFEPTMVTLRVSSTAGGSVSRPGEGTFAYEYCSTVELWAEPSRGYRFLEWTGDVGAIRDPRAASTVIDSMLKDYTIKAAFEPKTHKLEISSTEGGRVLRPGEGVYAFDHGTEVGLRVEAHPGYRFVGWTGDIATIPEARSTSTTVTMLNNYQIRAVFERKMYVLSVSSTENGRVTKPGEGVFPYGHEVEVALQVEADSGYRFAGWTGDTRTINDTKDTDTLITILGNYQIKAIFERQKHQLTLSSTEGGRVVAPGEGSFFYDHCTTVTLRAEPYCGYRFVGWIGDIDEVVDPSSANTSIDSMLEDYKIEAVFERKEHQLVISSTPCGKVTGPGEGVFVFPYCSEVELRVESDCDYRFVGWSGDIESIADPRSTHTVVEIRDDYVIKAEFERIWRFDILSFSLGAAVGALLVWALSQ